MAATLAIIQELKANGGTRDIGIHIEGEEIFTRPIAEVAGWLV